MMRPSPPKQSVGDTSVRICLGRLGGLGRPMASEGVVVVVDK